MVNNAIKTYYAAANGYTGFRSYFNTVFDRRKFNRVFIIKGGPGTGKSTLMKKILNTYRDKTLTESIVCSSDPNSLDGVIIEKDRNRIAILDGTAPHEEDTRYPGAIDEIVNLGEAWNEKVLLLHREEIIELCDTKKRAYCSAYDLLGIAGDVNFKKSAIVKNAYIGNDESVIFKEMSKIGNIPSGRTAKVKLISGFSSRGYNRFNVNGTETVSIIGQYGSEYIFLSDFKKALSISGTDFTVLYSPFSENIIEGLYIPITDILFLANAEGTRVINSSRFLDDTEIKRNSDLLDKYNSIEEDLLKLATVELGKASISHFKLEEIYKKSIDFDTLNRITQSIINEMNFILNN